MKINRPQFLLVLTSCLLLGVETSAQQKGLNWPNGKKAAVCMSYDDAILSHLEQAIPDLNRAGMNGTFYIQGTNLVPESIEAWRVAAAEGHELGCHSIFHPCSGKYDWVAEEYRTENYTLKRLFDELKVLNQFLFTIDGKHERTYAYPCHVKEVGGINYVDTLSRSGLFLGARNGISPDPLTSENLNLFDIPSMTVTDEVPFHEVTAYIEQAVENGTMAVFCFHGIGGDYIVTSREYHQKIIDYLMVIEDQIWVATLAEIAGHLSK
jgi:peptidoglycan/xylan/chitin deacetylase (PgdA/CDA1 family)